MVDWCWFVSPVLIVELSSLSPLCPVTPLVIEDW
jgi:hypothetical protein